MRLNKRHPLYQEDIQNVLSVPGIDFLKGKSVLVTGATGLIGVHLIDALMLLGGVKVYAIGRNKEKASTRLGEYFGRSEFVFIEQDVCQQFPDDIEADYIIPLASNTHPLAYSRFPVETVQINVMGLTNALNLAKNNGGMVLFPSTVEIYGNSRDNKPFRENDTGELDLSTARSCYTESKRVGEALCQSYLSEYGVQVKIARLSRVFGATMLESDTKASSQFIKKAISGEDIVLKSKGDQLFSYVYVSDAVAMLLHVMLHGKIGGIYNISNELCDVHLRDFAEICATCVNKNVVFELPVEDESKGYSIAKNAVLDNGFLKSLGFVPKYGIKDAIERTIEILR